jgi:4'-phosphopantetheinyl transferase
VRVWRVALDQPPARVRELSALLDRAERERAAGFVRDVDRDRFVVAHAALRRILGDWVGAAPASLRFHAGPNEKPLLRGGPHFNLSHSDGVALIAVSARGPVGVDVERVRPDCDVDAVAGRWFAPAELDRLRSVCGEERRARFFRLWTCKESCLKAGGLSLGAFERIAVSARPRGSRWRIAELRPAPGYVAAVAVDNYERIDTLDGRP